MPSARLRLRSSGTADILKGEVDRHRYIDIGAVSARESRNHGHPQLPPPPRGSGTLVQDIKIRQLTDNYTSTRVLVASVSVGDCPESRPKFMVGVRTDPRGVS